MKKVNVYRSQNEWCYALFIDGEFDSSGELDVYRGMTEAYALAAAALAFDEAEICRVEDPA